MSDDDARHARALRPPRDLGAAPLPGVTKDRPEDFRVEELPAYAPAGEGDHCFVHLEKRDLSTREAIRRLARALGVAARDVGAAGQKDRHAITTQWVSLPGVDPAEVGPRVVDAGLGEGDAWLRVLAAERHPKNLRTGHLRGNRFVLRIRDVDEASARDADARLERLAAEGIPNYFGSQRFGRANLAEAHTWLVAGGRAPRDRFLKRMLVIAHQSGAFNQALAERVARARAGAAACAQVRAGEVCRVEASGCIFVVAPGTEEAEAARVARWETSPTGPLFGPKMPAAEGAAADAERALAAAWGFTEPVLARLGRLGPGGRRAIRVRPGELERSTIEEGCWELRFTLPPGSYATVLLRELHGDPETPVSGMRAAPR